MTYGVVSLTVSLLFLWLLFFSGLRWKTRLFVLGTVFIAALLGAGLLRIGGVTGDLFPVLQWRFAPQPGSALRVKNAALAAPDSQHNGKKRPPALDYPQFLGANRNATVRNVQLEKTWASTPPRLLWKKALGAAWSAFSVSGSFAFTQEQRGKEEMVTC